MDRVEILKVMGVEKPFQQCVALVSLWNLVAQEIMTVTELEVEVSLSMEKSLIIGTTQMVMVMELVVARMTMMAVMVLQYLCFATEHTFNCHRVLKYMFRTMIISFLRAIFSTA